MDKKVKRGLRSLDTSLGNFNWVFFIPERRGQIRVYDTEFRFHRSLLAVYFKRAKRLQARFERHASGIHGVYAQSVRDDFTKLLNLLDTRTGKVTAHEISETISHCMLHLRGVYHE